MPEFATTREAKEFLISSIVFQAQTDNVPLTELEVKMLWHSETDATIPDMAEVNRAFDGDYDQAAYERKIEGLIRNLSADTATQLSWTEAVRTLQNEDHYLLVMIEAAGKSPRPRGDFLKLLATAIIIFVVLMAVIFIAARR